MTIDTIKLAFDKSMRTYDTFGRLHVAVSHISKATVNPYRGNEIPEAERLGLEPDRVYFLLRDPAELTKGADTFNNVQILSKHVPVFATAPQKELTIGSTGTDAAFIAPYLNNSLVINDANAIQAIEREEVMELSSAYSYDADMTPGTYEGVRYDGVMRNIKGNHVALVTEGRAGPDVVVMDSKPLEIIVSKKTLSAKAIAVRGALRAYLTPKIAQDAKLPDLTALVASVKAATFAKEKPKLAADAKKLVAKLLAKDATLDDLTDMLDTLDDGDDDGDMGLDDDDLGMDNDPSALLTKLLAGLGLAPDALQQANDLIGKMKPAADATQLPNEKPINIGPGTAPANAVSKPAMDAALTKARQETRAETIREMQAIAQAERDVQPFIGTVVAQDSAEAVYKLALDHAKVDLTGVHPSAYRAMVAMLPKHGTVKQTASRVAMDSATVTDFHTRFPNAKR